MTTRARKQNIIINVDWDSIENKPSLDASTFEALDAIGDVGTGADQVAQGNHSHNLSKSDVGLDNVDNTSDSNKPVSDATQTALDAKSDSHTHPYVPESHLTAHPAPTNRDERNQVAGTYLTTITKILIEAVLTGEITSHTHASSSGGISVAIDDIEPTGTETLWFQPTTGSLMLKIDGQWVSAVKNGEDGAPGVDGEDGAPGTGGSPTGTISLWGTDTPPTEHLLCDGSAISRTTYSALFTVLGTTYGVGDGSTTFNIPNIKGTVPVGKDAAQTEFDTLGKTGGEKTHQLTIDEMPSHTHQLMGDNDLTPDGGDAIGTDDTSDTDLEENACGFTGGDAAHNNLQPYIVLNYIIKT